MAKQHLSLPTKLFVAFGILLMASLILVLTFLNYIYNRQISEETYLRIHNGGKTTMNIILNSLSDLQLALKDTAQITKQAPSSMKTGELEGFCKDHDITYLCWQPFEKSKKSPTNLCGAAEADFCRVKEPVKRDSFRSNDGISDYNGSLLLEAQAISKDKNGFWKAGMVLTQDYINKINNLTGMGIILLSKKSEAPIISTLPMKHQPFANFESLPPDARQILDQFSVYTFKWTAEKIPYQFIFYPLLNLDNKLIGAIGVGFSLKAQLLAKQNMFYLSVLFTVSIVLAFFALGLLTARYFLQPLVDLKRTVMSFLGGGKSKVVGETMDEVSFLDESFKQITEELQKSLTLLEKAQVAEKRAHRETLLRLAIAAEYKDEETGTHILRLSRYCEIVARQLGLPENEVEIIRDASPMHDIGKVGIPDYILQKKGPLTAKEFEVMKNHPKIGASIFKSAGTPLYEACRIIAISHHERWDGTGYPQGLKAEEIPLYGRIVAVADVFDALTSERHYKPAYSLEKSLDIMKEEVGTHFDPQVMAAFIAALPEIKKVMGLKDYELKARDVDFQNLV